MSKVAWIGLGVMGYPMAGHIREKGDHDLVVYNRTGTKADKWVEQYGGETASTPAEAAKDADFVFICVGNDNDLRDVTLGPDGVFPGITADSKCKRAAFFRVNCQHALFPGKPDTQFRDSVAKNYSPAQPGYAGRHGGNFKN